jgi:hypothetical protein
MLAASHARVARLAAARLPSVRAFRVTQRALAVTETKKAYADLPSVHLLPDGTPAPPLEEWWSGEASRCTRASFVRTECTLFIQLFN